MQSIGSECGKHYVTIEFMVGTLVLESNRNQDDNLVSGLGLEPRTNALKGRCSTN